jgi:hypothetical protein
VYDSKADVWGWGVLFVEALTLTAPYAYTYLTPEQIALAVAEEQLMPVVPDDIDTDLQVGWKVLYCLCCCHIRGFVARHLVGYMCCMQACPAMRQVCSEATRVEWCFA